jgi:hypothetical protein
MSSHALRHVIDGSLSFAFSDHTLPHHCATFSMTLTTTPHSVQQLMVV